MRPRPSAPRRRAEASVVHQARPDPQIWHTECSGGDWQSEPFADLARLLITDRNHWSSATILWNLALDPATDTWTPELERDLWATVAWFGGEGSGVLDTTASDGLLATEVCSPDRRPAAIV